MAVTRIYQCRCGARLALMRVDERWRAVDTPWPKPFDKTPAPLCPACGQLLGFEASFEGLPAVSLTPANPLV